MKKLFKSYGIALVIVAIYAFVKLPVLRLDFTSGFTTLILFFVLAGILDMMLDRGENTSKMAKNNFLIAALLLIVIIIIPFFVTSPIFRAGSYRNLLGKVEESVFSASIFSLLVVAFIYALLAFVTFSSNSFSCVAYPLTVSIRFGIRSNRLCN